jgi:sugar O-acyltransferase (sialic acid O-acetyltransferase NeuD family)
MHTESTPNKRSDAIVLLGGGGHALVIADVARSLGMSIEGFLDDSPSAVLADQSQHPSATHLGSGALLPQFLHHPLILATGDLAFRRRLLVAAPADARWANVTHESALVSMCASVAPHAGVFIAPRAVVNARARIAAHAIINTGAIVEHEAEIGENAHVAPGSIVAGRAIVGADTLIGLGAILLPRVRVGRGCTIGAGAVVRRDVSDGTTVVGVPAHPLSV